MLLIGSLGLEGPFKVLPIIALIFEEIFDVPQLTLVVEVFLSNRAFLIELFGKCRFFRLLFPILKVCAETICLCS